MTKFFRITRTGAAVLLGGFKDLLNIFPDLHNYSNLIPKDPRTIITQLNLDPHTERYVCCQKCWALTPYTRPQKGIAPSPLLCTEKLTSGSPLCGNSLWREENGQYKPNQVYIHQVLKNWIGRLLSRPGIEDVLVNYPKAAAQEAGRMKDIWRSPEIQTLTGPDGKLFMDAPEGEYRLVFGLAGDGFNPFYNKTAKQFDNICHLGTIPPDRPTVDRYGHFLRLIVDNLLEFWDPGVFFSRTYKHAGGSHAKGLLIPLAADMLALREFLGFTSSTSTHFCPGCFIALAYIENFDPSTWPSRDHETHMRHAKAWKDAKTVKEQETLASQHGVRWSELLRLPYWKVVEKATVEPMHALDSGLIEQHVRDILRIDLKDNGGDGSGPRMPRPSKPADDILNAEMVAIMTVIQLHRHKADFLNLVMRDNKVTFRGLWYLCYAHKLRLAGDRRDRLILRLKKWLQALGMSEAAETTDDGRGGAVLGIDVMNVIWDYMTKTILPGWVGKAPKNWGTAKRGKLSAANWRIIFTIHMPIALIWLWRDEVGRKKEILDNMMDLVTAIWAASSRETSEDIAQIFDEHYLRYMTRFIQLFPEDNVHPNQHCAFHISSNLRRFGPGHTRGAQFYERLIHVLQGLNTNMKKGEMEITFMNETAHSANLGALL
ncbi:hypothetical protein C8F01DRAFT_977459, partial [Mycena amicta]